CHLLDIDAIAPVSIPLEYDAARESCPIVRSLRTGVPELFDLSHIATLPPGLAKQRITQAYSLPLIISGQQRPVGTLIAAVNPTRRLDSDYQTFFNLIATQVSNAIQNARAVEEEKLRADLLTEIDKAKTTFFSNISHEFRTPLTLMLGPITDVLAESEELSVERRRQIELVRHNALRLQKLVNNLLDFSRLQAGRMRASFVPVDLAAMTADLASGFRSAIEHAGMRLEVDCQPLNEAMYVDPSMWEKIVLNLLSNAFKFTFAGSITVRLYQSGDHVVLEVADTGVGIPAAELPRLFERFHRVEESRARTHEGSGIGLALVQDLVALHEGEISVVSEENCGSTFSVRIPAGTSHLDPKQISLALAERDRSSVMEAYVTEAEKWVQHAPADDIGADDGMSIRQSIVPLLPDAARILVADDNADMRHYLKQLLQHRWHVETVPDGELALAAVRRQRPDVILSDAMMPRLNGFELLNALRADNATADIPFFLLSARAGEEARVEGLQAGADEYLVKPFSSRELIARIEAALVRRHIRRIEDAFAQRMHSVFEQAPVAIAITRGPDHVFELANPRHMELVGHRPLVGLNFREAFPELEKQNVYHLMDDAYRSGKAVVGELNRVQLRRGPDGRMEECFFNFVHQPLFDYSGNVEGIAIVSFEVTELANARRAAESANRAKDEFLAMLGHELRNPLAPIITALQLMRLRGVTVAKKERDIIERQARHLVALVDDLLDVSRVTQGKVQLRKIPIEVAEIVAKALETSGPLLEEKRHRVEIDVPATGLRINADAERMAQVVANLLTNAAKYTEPEGRIEIEAYGDGSDAVISVRDNGIGISADMLPAVFDTFVQEQQALNRSRGGLGLGLAIAKSMTLLHDGTIAAHSAGTDRGSTFVVRIPLATESTAGESLPELQNGTEAPAQEGLRVLIVDDNLDAAQLLAEALALHGHRTMLAHDGASALHLLDAAQSEGLPDVALLDIGLPIMDGYELARRLRCLPEGGDIYLVAVTGYGQKNDQQQALDVGFDCHMVKPVDMKQLDDCLRKRQAEIARKSAGH
ncbi:MAG TPA: ATP-binding protein, partial [Oxalicibacterium sp.]|nr:ATP-binding protein [Oxalicibacterium sp.]